MQPQMPLFFMLVAGYSPDSPRAEQARTKTQCGPHVAPTRAAVRLPSGRVSPPGWGESRGGQVAPGGGIELSVRTRRGGAKGRCPLSEPAWASQPWDSPTEGQVAGNPCPAPETHGGLLETSRDGHCSSWAPGQEVVARRKSRLGTPVTPRETLERGCHLRRKPWGAGARRSSLGLTGGDLTGALWGSERTWLVSGPSMLRVGFHSLSVNPEAFECVWWGPPHLPPGPTKERKWVPLSPYGLAELYTQELEHRKGPG